MKSHFNVVLDVRDDGTKVWSAKCLRCDAVLVGEQANLLPTIVIHGPPDYPPLPQSVIEAARAQI